MPGLIYSQILRAWRCKGEECSAGLPPGLRKTCGTFFRSSRIRGSPHKPRGPALQNKKHLIARRHASERFSSLLVGRHQAGIGLKLAVIPVSGIFFHPQPFKNA